MRETPETDRATIASGGDWSPVLRETCRRLERERNDAREALREAWLAMDEIDGTDRMVNWQNKHASILEVAK